MFNRHWMRVVAFIGCLTCILSTDSHLLAQQPQTPNENTAQQDQTQTAQPAPEKKYFGPDNYETECAKRQESSEADLCQQWRMANAAERQVEIIRDQLSLQKWEVGLLIGTLIASSIAVFVTLFVAIRQLRAYVTASPTILYGLNGKEKIQIHLAVKNCGHTPARTINFRYSIFLLNVEDMKPGPPIALASTINNNYSLFPQDDMTVWFTSEVMVTDEDRDEIKKGKKRLYVFGIVNYRDVFKWRRITRISASAGADFVLNLADDKVRCTWHYEPEHLDPT